ncbi:MAG: DUF1080 domain-containing protein, partial [Bacteroidales bacterium]
MQKNKFVILLLLGSLVQSYAQDGWKFLFNGMDLKGWEQLNGKANYYVENGELVGETVFNSPNSFLCTQEHYSDFILEFEV